MTTPDRLEHDLPDLLAVLVTPPVAGDLTDTLGRISGVRQRPAWTFLESWLPLDITAKAPTLLGRAPALRPIVLVVSLALVILAGFLVYVGSPPKIPPPFGLARNGVLLIQTSPGFDIVAADLATGAITTLIAGPTSHAFRPVFSPDGRRFLFVRDDRLLVANADGTGIRELIAPACSTLTADWSPDGDRLAVTGGSCTRGSLISGNGILDLEDGTWTPLRLSGNVEGWLPSTELMVMIGRTQLSLVNADGTGGREIAAWPRPLEGWTLSPDGSKFAYMNYGFYTTGGDPHPHILDLETGIDRRLDMEGRVVQFSPDGTQLLVEIIDFRQVRTRSLDESSSETLVPPGQLAILPLDGGPTVPIDLPSKGLAGLTYSPDGTMLLADYDDEATGRVSTWLFDIVSGHGRQLFLPASIWPIPYSSWQRLAP